MNRIPHVHPGDRPSASQTNSQIDAINQFLNMVGDGLVQVKRSGTTTTLALDVHAIGDRQRRTVTITRFEALIGSSTAADSPAQNRWLYAWQEVHRTALGYDGWGVVTDGRAGSTTVDPARNYMEDGNTGAGVECPGMDVANLDTANYTFTIQPCPSNVIRTMEERKFTLDGTEYIEYWFDYSNGVDGACD